MTTTTIPFVIMGDTHGSWDSRKLDTLEIDLTKTNSKLEYLIIAGDFGFIWESNNSGTDIGNHDIYNITAYFSKRPWTTLFVPGNHENYDVLDKLPRTTKWGGLVAEILPDKVYMLDKGEVYTILGKTLLACGGANSIDKNHRRAHISWWPQEEFTEFHYKNACKNLDKVNWKVDFVISHTCPHNVYQDFKYKLPSIYPECYWEDKLHDKSTDYLQLLADKLDFKSWYFGHFHYDIKIPVGEKYYEMLYDTYTEPKM